MNKRTISSILDTIQDDGLRAYRLFMVQGTPNPDDPKESLEKVAFFEGKDPRETAARLQMHVTRFSRDNPEQVFKVFLSNLGSSNNAQSLGPFYFVNQSAKRIEGKTLGDAFNESVITRLDETLATSHKYANERASEMLANAEARSELKIQQILFENAKQRHEEQVEAERQRMAEEREALAKERTELQSMGARSTVFFEGFLTKAVSKYLPGIEQAARLAGAEEETPLSPLEELQTELCVSLCEAVEQRCKGDLAKTKAYFEGLIDLINSETKPQNGHEFETTNSGQSFGG